MKELQDLKDSWRVVRTHGSKRQKGRSEAERFSGISNSQIEMLVLPGTQLPRENGE